MSDSFSKTSIRRRTVLAGASALLAMPAVRAYANTDTKLVLRTDLAAWGVQIALFHAQEKGWFKEAGLDIDIQDGTGTLNTINLVGAGQVDVGFVQLGPAAVAKTSGVPVKAIGGYVRKSDLAVMVDKQTGPGKPEELAGKKLVCFATSPWAPFIDTYLAHYGLKRGTAPDQVNVVMVSPAAMVSTYAAGNADGFMSLSEYALPLAEIARPSRALAAVDAGVFFPSYGFVVNEEALASKSAQFKALNATQRRAWEEIVAKPEAMNAAVDSLIKARPNAQINRQVLLQQAQLSLTFLDTPNAKGRYGWQAEADWEQALTYMKSVGILPASAKPSDFYTNDLVA